MKKRLTASVLLLPFFAVLVHHHTTPTAAADTTFSYTASDQVIVNPERGLYEDGPLVDGTDFQSLRDAGYSLCYSNLLLAAFRTIETIHPDRLLEIDNAFTRMRAAGMKGIVRITYNNDAGGLDTTTDLMTLHLQHLQPVLNANTDVIAMFQAGMIGAWGEWHTSTNDLANPDGYRAVFDLLITYLPAHRFIQIRTPEQVIELPELLTNPLTNPLTDATAFQNTPRARIAHHNDCWLSSATDSGTYPDDAEARGIIKEKLEEHTRYAPWGGETCELNTDFAECLHATTEAARFHATYLNGAYHPLVINELQGCWNDFKKYLGYRFELISATLPDSLSAGAPSSFEINLRNTGWAPVYNERPVFLRILAGSVVIQNLPLPADPRFWRPEAGDIQLTGNFVAPADVPANQLGFALWMPDHAPGLQSNPAYSIQCANQNTWQATAGQNTLKEPAAQPPGVFTIDGAFDDWIGHTATFIDPPGDAGTAETDITSVWIVNDADKLFLRIKTTIAIDWTNTSRTNIYLDTDQNPATGFSVTSAVGSEILIQGGIVYRLENGVFDPELIPGFPIEIAPAGLVTDVEISIDRDAAFPDESPVFGPSGVTLVIQSEDSGYNLQESAPDTGGQSFAWTAATDDPPPVFKTAAVEPVTGAIRVEWKDSAPHRVYPIEVSDDLIAWRLLGRAIAGPTGQFLFVDAAAAGKPRRFYRIILD